MRHMVPFYVELSWYLTPDQVVYELSVRHPVGGRVVMDEWTLQRRAGLLTPEYIAGAFWDGALDLLERADTLKL